MYTYPYLNKTKGKCIHSIVVLIIKRIYKTLHIKSIFTLINATYQIHDFGLNINLMRTRTVLMETKAIMSEMLENPGTLTRYMYSVIMNQVHPPSNAKLCAVFSFTHKLFQILSY